MISDQLESILKDTSTIDKLKRSKHNKKKSSFQLIKDVFGNDPIWWWFLPTSVNQNFTVESQY